jgi:hypothetical protein
MPFSQQFRALGRVAIVFAGAWAAIGGAVAAFTWVIDRDGSFFSRVAAYLVMYGSAGAISGIITALILARALAGRRVEQVATGRVAGWGMVGGLAPSAFFVLLGLAFGAPSSSYLPLLGLGAVSAGIGAAVAASVFAVAKRGTLATPLEKPHLPAT